MKIFLSGLALASFFATSAHAALTIPGANGSDGALNVPTGTVTIDLSQAASGHWNDASPTPGRGVYDPDKWAVVFHYTSVNIASGATLMFKNGAANPPVVWLVAGDVTVDGKVSVEGTATDPGPGGFPHLSGAADEYSGRGPGGAFDLEHRPGYGSADRPASYGNAPIVPLIGGSGAFAGGGGAILIAATGAITLNGKVSADGMYGTGGAVRLVADSITGAGSLSAVNLVNPAFYDKGRIRIEANFAAPTLIINPVPSVDRPATPASIWPDADAPTVRIVSVGPQAVPDDPRAALGTKADITPDMITGATPLDVIIETRNVTTDSVVNLRVAAANTTGVQMLPATLVSGTAAKATWKVNLTLPVGSAAMQVRVEAKP